MIFQFEIDGATVLLMLIHYQDEMVSNRMSWPQEPADLDLHHFQEYIFLQ